MSVRILIGDCRQRLAELPADSAQMCMTSPPYFGLRDYGVDGQIGLEQTPEAYIAELVAVFREARRALRTDGTLWLNLGDSYANDGKWGGSSGGKHVKALHGDTNVGRGKKTTGAKPKDLLMIPARVALALQADGWYLRSDIIWHKPNAMPESVTDRPTSAHEHVFLLTKAERYFYDADAISEEQIKGASGSQFNSGKTAIRQLGRASDAPRIETGKRNARNVWSIATQPYSEAHFATMSPELAERCIKAGSRPGDTVIDPFGGAGTTAMVSDRLGRNSIICELNPEYAAIAEKRLSKDAGMFASLEVA